MPKADPTGRMDVFVIRVLERLVERKADLPTRMVYAHLKPKIDRSLRHYLRGLNLKPEQLRAALEAANQAKQMENRK